jgi:hypothetical protein
MYIKKHFFVNKNQEKKLSNEVIETVPLPFCHSSVHNSCRYKFLYSPPPRWPISRDIMKLVDHTLETMEPHHRAPNVPNLCGSRFPPLAAEPIWITCGRRLLHRLNILALGAHNQGIVIPASSHRSPSSNWHRAWLPLNTSYKSGSSCHRQEPLVPPLCVWEREDVRKCRNQMNV